MKDVALARYIPIFYNICREHGMYKYLSHYDEIHNVNGE